MICFSFYLSGKIIYFQVRNRNISKESNNRLFFLSSIFDENFLFFPSHVWIDDIF